VLLVAFQALLRQGERIRIDQRGNRNLNPLIGRQFMARSVARGQATALT
jgi:hypothetical protein